MNKNRIIERVYSKIMVNIRQNLVPADKYGLKCPNAMEPEYITIHNTANDASAANEISYMINNNDATSYHYAVDDVEIVQGVPTNRNAWHAGDGANGTGNRKSIAIEICYSKSGGDRFTKAENNAAEFTAYLLRSKGWSIGRVKKHQDFSGKYCPHRTLDLGWERFLDIVRKYLNASSSSSVTNSTAPGIKTVNYRVKVNTEQLNIRTGPGTSYKIAGTVKKGEVYTIVAESNGFGKLKSGAGYISLSYTVKQ